MINYLENHYCLESFTGLEFSEFDSICQEVELKYPEYEIKRFLKERRRRREQDQ